MHIPLALLQTTGTPGFGGESEANRKTTVQTRAALQTGELDYRQQCAGKQVTKRPTVRVGHGVNKQLEKAKALSGAQSGPLGPT